LILSFKHGAIDGPSATASQRSRLPKNHHACFIYRAFIKNYGVRQENIKPRGATWNPIPDAN